jgi:Tfp pilus assembly protein PilZ
MLPQPRKISRQHTRADPRVDFFGRVRVIDRGRERCLNCRAENISRGGIYICGTQVLSKGARIALEVETKRHGPLWVEAGEVVWSKPVQRSGVPIPPGMGVRFIAMSARSRKLIDEEITRIRTRRPRPGHLRRLTPVPPEPIRVETQDIIPIRSKRYLLQLLIAIVAGLAVGAFSVSIIMQKQSTPAEPPGIVQAKVVPTAPKPRPVKKKVVPARVPVPEAKVELPVLAVKAVEGPPSVGRPEFRKTPKGWRMVLEASAPVKIKHFKLKNPPRLAVDLYKTDYTGDKKRLSSPAGFISRVRVGEQPGFVRFVLDFKGKRVPRHRVTKKNGKAVVSFF